MLTIRDRLARQGQDVFLGEGVNYIDEQLRPVVNVGIGTRSNLHPVLKDTTYRGRLEKDREAVYRRGIWEIGSDLA
jgi:hypothetical protein